MFIPKEGRKEGSRVRGQGFLREEDPSALKVSSREGEGFVEAVSGMSRNLRTRMKKKNYKGSLLR